MSRRIYVQGYYRQDGTWVPPHFRRAPQRDRNAKQYRSSSGQIPVQRRTRDHQWTKRRAEHEQQLARLQREEDRIRKAADFCYATITEDEVNAAAQRVAAYVTDDAWSRLYRKWKPSRCRWLEQLAQVIMDTKSEIHQSVADLAMLRLWTPLHKPEQIFAHQLIQNIPLPGGEHFIASACGVRLAGVSLCVIQDMPLVQCACFSSLAKQFTKEQVKSFLVSTGTDWMRGLGRQR